MAYGNVNVPGVSKADLDGKADKQNATGGFGAGEDAKASLGGAVGKNSNASSGGAVGAYTKAGTGGAVGYYAETDGGGAVGFNAKTNNGFAGGYNARTNDSSGIGIDAIQLGTGTNRSPNTLQVYSYQLMDASGNIPAERLGNLVGKSLAGKTVSVDNATTVTAGEGAEVFNDYRDRTFNSSGSVSAGNVASGLYSHAEGGCTTASGTWSHAEGTDTKASGVCAHTEGTETIASGSYSHAEGRATKASAHSAHAEGNASIASGTSSHAGGVGTKALGDSSSTFGGYTISQNYQMAVGKFNTEYAGPTGPTVSTGGALFIVGKGTSDTARSNAFRVDNGTSGVYGVGSYHTSGADYAEHFEWLDGNTDGEDRRGLFVTLDGEKIRFATAEDDYILGVISATPTVVGDSQEDEWRGRYLTDVFGEREIEVVTVPEYTDETTGETIPEHDETRYIQNPNYDSEKEYISREKRAEWAVVGLMGKLVVVDDGTCEVNGYCYPGDDGIATKANKGYRVMKRIDETHVKILLR